MKFVHFLDLNAYEKKKRKKEWQTNCRFSVKSSYEESYFEFPRFFDQHNYFICNFYGYSWRVWKLLILLYFWSPKVPTKRVELPETIPEVKNWSTFTALNQGSATFWTTRTIFFFSNVYQGPYSKKKCTYDIY
jgi:hypothetical protein